MNLTADLPDPNQLIPMTYGWQYGGKSWTWELNFSKAAYEYYKALPRAPTENYSIYVTHPLDDTYITRLANKIEEASKQEGYSEFETISFAAAFVQSLPYTSDSTTKGFDEYPRFPVETLVDNGGDCEDTAILMASLVQAMGYGVVLIVFPSSPDKPGHAALGIKGGEGIHGTYWEYGGDKYFYLETTNAGWSIGKLPTEYQNAKARVYPMVPVPVLTHEWTSSGKGNFISLKIRVSNLGSAPANSVYVLAGFDAGDDKVWNRQLSNTFELPVNEQAELTLNLIPPIGEHTRLVIQIALDGYAVDESYSKWFDT